MGICSECFSMLNVYWKYTRKWFLAMAADGWFTTAMRSYYSQRPVRFRIESPILIV